MSFIKSLLVSFFILLLGSSSCSREKSSTGLLYEIRKHGSSKKSYLAGEIHFIPKTLFNMTDAALYSGYIDRCKLLVMEANFDSSAHFFAKFKKEYHIKSNRHVLNEQELNYLRSFLKDTLNQNDEIIEKILDVDPITTGNNMTKMYLKDPIFYMDTYLRNYARENNKKIEYLDSPERYYYYVCQYNLLSYENPWFRNDSLKNKYFQELNLLFEEYGTNNVINYNTIDLTSKEYLINQRNREWIAKIEDIINKEDCVILVGKGHLEGLIRLLKAKDYIVRPV